MGYKDFLNAPNDFKIENGCLLQCYTYEHQVIIPEGVTSIGDRAFYNKSVNIIHIPNSVKKIGKWAFASCLGLQHIAIPNGVESIDDYAFDGCRSLKSITIPNSVKHIGIGAFYGCDNLKLYFNHLGNDTNPYHALMRGLSPNGYGVCVIGYNIAVIADDALKDCQQIKSFVCDNNPNYKAVDGVLYSKNGKKLIRYPADRDDAVFIIPKTVTEINAYAFAFSKKLISITIPNSVKYIGNSVFYGCRALTNINIPNGVTHIGNGAFGECPALQNVTIPNTVTSIGFCAFSCSCYSIAHELLFIKYKKGYYLGNEENPYYALVGIETNRNGNKPLFFKVHPFVKIYSDDVKRILQI